MITMQRGQVFQVAPVIPDKGWQDQPDLVYALSGQIAITRKGKIVPPSPSWEPRGTVQKIETKAKLIPCAYCRRRTPGWTCIHCGRSQM